MTSANSWAGREIKRKQWSSVTATQKAKRTLSVFAGKGYQHEGVPHALAKANANP